MHDIDWAQAGSYEWLTQVWIPVFVGIATTAVAVFAWRTSKRAADLAHQIERDRAADEEARRRASDRDRLLAMSNAEARALRRWVVEVQKTDHARPRPGNHLGYEMPRTEAEQAAIDAEVLLEQSLVSAGPELLTLTRYDIENRDAPMNLIFPDPSLQGQLSWQAATVASRDRRTLDRIRRWGLNPELLGQEILADLERAQTEPLGYLNVGIEARS